MRMWRWPNAPLVVTCTPAAQVVLHSPPRDDAFIAAVGAFTPQMVELSPRLCRLFAELGTVVVDTPDARHEAGDLLQAGWTWQHSRHWPTWSAARALRSRAQRRSRAVAGRGWDLAVARLAAGATGNTRRPGRGLTPWAASHRAGPYLLLRSL